MNAREHLASAPGSGRLARWRRGVDLVRRDHVAVAAAGLLALIILFCLLWPLVAPYDANAVDFARSDQLPSLSHPLGTDHFGRDLVSRVAIGGRTSLEIGGIALAIIFLIGVPYGTIAAIGGGKLDAAMMRAVDGLFAIPRLPIAIVILVAFRISAPTIGTIAFALSITGWMLTARLVRGVVQSLKTRNFVLAARAVGARSTRIALHHLIPNAAGIILIALFLELPTVILGEAFLAVLGLGVEPPTATWGNIAEEGLHFSRLWSMSVATAAIAIFALSANVLADRLGDVLDPRRRR